MSKHTKPTRQQVEAALSKCIDPELGIDVVSLGLIYGIALAPDQATITMTLTTPGCPLIPYLKQQIVDQVTKIDGISQVEIILTFDPPWTPDKITPAAKAQLTMLRG